MAFSRLVSPSGGATIVSNFPADGTSQVTNASGQNNAQGFAVAGQTFTLDSVSLVLSGYGGGTGFRLNLVSDSGSGQPSGAVLTGFNTIPVIGTTADTFTLSPLQTVTLSPGTTYWLVAQSSDSVFWYQSTAAPVGTATLAAGMRNTGGGWQPTGSRFAVEIQATAVPEPNVVWWGAVSGALGLAFGRRRHGGAGHRGGRGEASGRS